MASAAYDWTQSEKIINVSVSTASFAIVSLVIVLHRKVFSHLRKHNLTGLSILVTLLAWLLFSICNFCLIGILTTKDDQLHANFAGVRIIQLRLTTRLMSTLTIGVAQVSTCIQLGRLVYSHEVDSSFLYITATGILTVMILTASALTSIWVSCLYVQVTFLTIENVSTMCIDSKWLWLVCHLGSMLTIAVVACHAIFTDSTITLNERLSTLPVCIPWVLSSSFAIMVYRVEIDSGISIYLQTLQTALMVIVALYAGIRPKWIKLFDSRGNLTSWNLVRCDPRNTFYWNANATSQSNKSRCTKQISEDEPCSKNDRLGTLPEPFSSHCHTTISDTADIKKSADKQLCKAIAEDNRSSAYAERGSDELSAYSDQDSLSARAASSEEVKGYATSVATD